MSGDADSCDDDDDDDDDDVGEMEPQSGGERFKAFRRQLLGQLQQLRATGKTTHTHLTTPSTQGYTKYISYIWLYTAPCSRQRRRLLWC